MTDLAVSDSLKNRREALVWQRRWKRLRSCWQLVAVAGLAGGMVWVMSWPEWSIRSPQQVTFRGNQLLTADTLHKVLPLTYPQAIWLLSTDQLGEKLAQNPALMGVEVTRHLFPAHLTITVQERKPVAIAVSEKGFGYLDRDGNFIPRSLYRPAIQAKLPKKPEFLGYAPQYRTFWRTYQPHIQQSSVQIRLIDGNNPSNVTLGTALGIVHLGSDLSQFGQQLTVLENLKNLPRQVPKERLVFIDLSNPEDPRVQLRPAPPKSTANKVKKP